MIHIVDSICSTNDWLAKYHFEVDDTILAIEQTQGKGRRGNTWESKIGGFYISTVSSNHKLLPFVVGISIMKVLEDFSIIGIGINSENRPDIANSTNLVSNGINLDKSVILASFLYNFDIISSFTSDKIIEIFTTYDCLIGNEIFWNDLSGVVKSIALDGSLVVESSGKELNLYSEEVQLEKY